MILEILDQTTRLNTFKFKVWKIWYFKISDSKYLVFR